MIILFSLSRTGSYVTMYIHIIPSAFFIRNSISVALIFFLRYCFVLSDDQVDCGIHQHWLCVIIDYDSTKFDGECLFRRTIRLLSPWQICRPILLILQGRRNLFGFPKKHLIKFHINE